MTLGEQNKNLPWVEKYRPSKLEDLVSHDDIITTINQFMNENQLPHLLFYGPPGTGKTSTILACARKLYTPQQFSSMVLELNASDDRGIGIVRGQILSFASTRTIFKAGPKLIILDEADAMTNDAQNALRRSEKWNKMSESDEEMQSKTVKITVLGEPSTGKSTLCARYLGTSTSSSGGTPGAEVFAGQCLGLRPPVPLQICDVAGNALHTNMLDNYVYASDIVLFVYDLTNLQSFERLNLWVDKVKTIVEQENMKPLMALFGNKSDLEHQRAVRFSSVQIFASEHLLESFKGSARTGEMVNSAFTSLVARVLGVKVKRAPTTQNGRTSNNVVVENAQNSKVPVPVHQPSLSPNETTQSLIMNRKALRKIQRKASSSVVKMSEDGEKALLTLSGGDMRKVLNTLQSTWLAYRDVTEDNVYTCVGHPLRCDINAILNWLLNENDFSTCFKHIQDLKIRKGLALSDILTEIHALIHRVKLPPDVLESLLINMADAEARLAGGASERIELAALIATFHVARQNVKMESDS